MLLAVAAGCHDEASQAPSPPRYDWPDEFYYRVEFVAAEQFEGRVTRQFGDSRTVRFMIRDDESYLVLPDSVLKTRNDPGGPRVFPPYAPEDTLSWYVRLGRLGEFEDVVLACDPAIDACRAVPRSALALDLRRFIPRLSSWPVPRGGTWADTVSLVDPAGGTSGVFTTEYRVVGDTVIDTEAFWQVQWRSLLQTYRASAGGVPLALPPAHEDGVTFVEKRRLIPLYSSWAGTRIVPADSGPPLATGFRGRAWLVGSSFDSALTRPQ